MPAALVDHQTLGTYPATPAAKNAALPASGPQTDRRPQGVERDPVCAHDRDRLATTPARARLRFPHDVLASPARLATDRRLAAAARTAARSAPQGRAARPLARRLRLCLAARAFGGTKTGPSPVDRRKAGSKHHLITDANGVPLACLLTGANRHDVTQLLPLADAIRPCAANSDDHAADPTRSSPTAATTPSRYAPAGSDRSSSNATPNTDPASAANAGSSNAPSPGSTSTDAYASATNAAPTSTKPSSASPAASSASGASTTHSVRRSKSPSQNEARAGWAHWTARRVVLGRAHKLL
jgi:hypothetical protein